MEKICIGLCKRLLKENIENFEFRNDSKKFRNLCRDCCKKEQKEYSENHKKEAIEYRKKNKKHIRKNKQRWYQENKESILLNKKEYVKNNKDKIKKYKKEYDSKYYIKNKDKFKEYKKEYNKKNKEKIAIRARNNIKKARANNIGFRLKGNIARSIVRNLKNKGFSKNKKSTLKYLGCSKYELQEHFKTLFELWMTIENYGIYNPNTWNDNEPTTWTWQIDHIVPHSEFNYTSMEDEEFKKCWALSNLRPYSSKQNIIDGSTRVRHNKSQLSAANINKD